jgi:hypothetical protein
VLLQRPSTEEQWNKPEVQPTIAKAKELAGNDPDLEMTFRSTALRAAGIAGGGGARMTVGDGASPGDPKIPCIEVPAIQARCRRSASSITPGVSEARTRFVAHHVQRQPSPFDR